MPSLYVMLLAGGIGSRLAPLSTPEHPKQFLHLPGADESLLQQTARCALELTSAERIITVTYAHFAEKVAAELAQVDVGLTQHVLLEPDGAGTAAAAAVAALKALSLDKDAVLWLLPCDHARQPCLQLPALKPDVIRLASQHHIVTFGVKASQPDSGYGYLTAHGHQVKRFSEKPDVALAAQLLDEGAHWNSGMFAFLASDFIARMTQLDDALLSQCRRALANGQKHEEGYQLCDSYTAIRPQSIDVAVMEKTDRLAMLKLADGWADVGTWPRLTEWWLTHAPHIPTWDFNAGQPYTLADLQKKHVD